MLLNIKYMYPCIKIGIVDKAVNYFSRGLLIDQKMIIETTMKLIKFRRRSTILTFHRKYYEFGIIEDRDNKGTTISNSDGVFVSDLVAYYILLDLVATYINYITCIKIYHNHIIIVWNKIVTGKEVSEWIENFQAKVNLLLESDKLQFMVTLWKPEHIAVVEINTDTEILLVSAVLVTDELNLKDLSESENVSVYNSISIMDELEEYINLDTLLPQIPRYKETD